MLDSDPMNRPSSREAYEKADSLCVKLEKLQQTKKNSDLINHCSNLQREKLQAEMEELIDLFKPFLELKKEETMQKLKDVANHLTGDAQANKSECVLNTLKTVDNFIQNTRNFTRTILIK